MEIASHGALRLIGTDNLNAYVRLKCKLQTMFGNKASAHYSMSRSLSPLSLSESKKETLAESVP